MGIFLQTRVHLLVSYALEDLVAAARSIILSHRLRSLPYMVCPISKSSMFHLPRLQGGVSESLAGLGRVELHRTVQLAFRTSLGRGGDRVVQRRNAQGRSQHGIRGPAQAVISG